MTAFETMQEYYRKRDLAAKEWKERGGNVVGYLCTNTPEELIYASGMLPVRIVGDPGEPVTLGDRYIDDICCPFIRSYSDLLLKGKYEYLDAIIWPNSCDAMLRSYYSLLDAKPKYRLPRMFLIDIPRSRGRRQYAYLLQELNYLKAFLEEILGNKIPDKNLLDAIQIYNENKVLLERIDRFRREAPARLSCVEAYQIIGSGFRMAKDKHNKLLRQFLESNSNPKPKEQKVRLFSTGSILDNLSWVSLVEKHDAVIVSDDSCVGTRYYSDQVKLGTSLSPMEALAERYLFKSPCARIMPTRDRLDYMKQVIEKSNVDGVIFYFLKWCDVQGWDYPKLKGEIDKLNIDSILFEGQEYTSAVAERQAIRIETFVEIIKERGQR